MVGDESRAMVNDVSDLKRLLRWEDAGIIDPRASDGLVCIPVKDDLIMVRLPCPASEIFERITEHVIAPERGRPRRGLGGRRYR